MTRNALPALLLALVAAIGLVFVACDDDDEVASSETQSLPLTVSEDLAQSWMGLFAPSLNSWHWDSAILMLGLMELSEATGDSQYRDYVQAWMDHHIQQGYYITSSDTSIPGRVALKLYAITGEAKYKQVADEVWDYIKNKAVRTNEGGLNHAGNLTERQIWVDTLFMVGPFLVEYGELIGSPEPVEEFKNQLTIFRNRLREANSGMYYHRYDEVNDAVTPETDIFWGRGNGWVFVASNFGYRYANAAFTEPGMFDIASDMQDMHSFVAQNLPADGVMHTLVNEPSSYLETSAGVLWAYGLGLGMESGIFPDSEWPMLLKLLNGGLANVIQAPHGEWLFLGVSYGTSPGNFDYYQEVLKGENVAYGLGAFFLAAAQAEKVRPADANPVYTFDPDGSLTSQSYQVKPEPCSGNDCGKWYINRGHFTNAMVEFEGVLAQDADDVEANYFAGLINMVRVITTYIVLQDAVPVGALTDQDVLDWMETDAKPMLDTAIARLDMTTSDSPGLETTLERLLIFESGGHTCIGSREYDHADALIVKGVCYALKGGLPLLSELDTDALPAPDAGFMERLSGLRQLSTRDRQEDIADLVEGLDLLEQGIQALLAETDDQSDDFIPANLFQGTGTFTIPGILPPTDCRELLTSLGITEESIDNGTAAEDVLGFIGLAKTLLPALLGGS